MEKRPDTSFRTRWWDLPSVFLLFILLTTAFTRLIVTDWTSGLVVTRYISYLAIIAGLALGYSRFSPRVAALFAIFYGVFAVPWRLGMLMGEGILWNERLISMAGRLQIIITQLAQKRAVTDSFLFLVLMGLLFWALGVYAGYSLTRYANPWRMILPTGVALVLIHSYDSFLASRAWYLVIYLFFSLILVARLVYLHNHHRWQKTNTYIPPYIGVDFIRITLAATAILLLLTWTTPALADTVPEAQDIWQKIKEPWNDLRNVLDNAFASLRSSVGIVTDYYGPSMSLGRGNRLTDSQVFTVQVPNNIPPGTRFYWRARVYDEYNNGWTSTLLTTELVSPDTFNLVHHDTADNATGFFSFAFTVSTPIATLLTAQDTVWVSRPAKLELAYDESGRVDLASVRASPPLRAGETYNLRATLNQITVTALQNAGENYPEWVTERYLQLPTSITPRTIQLAQAIAGDKETPYDKVLAITNYLRDNIEYSETVPPLPTDQELVDWFLFDLKSGFCNYYATAEVVLLRSLGIPARLAVGYAQGEPVEASNAYVVLQRDSHAWPEVYFPGIGWVEFEPTLSQPPITRPLGLAGTDNAAQPTPPVTPLDRGDNFESPRLRELEAAEEAAARQAANRAIGIGTIVTGLLLALFLLFVSIRRNKQIRDRLPNLPIMLEASLRRIGLQPPAFIRQWAQLARLSPISRSYQEINAALSRIGLKPAPTQTPSERVHSLEEALPPTGNPAHRLLTEYQTAIYSRDYSPNLFVAQKAGKEIRSLSYRAWLQRMVNGKQKSKPTLKRIL